MIGGVLKGQWTLRDCFFIIELKKKTPVAPFSRKALKPTARSILLHRRTTRRSTLDRWEKTSKVGVGVDRFEVRHFTVRSTLSSVETIAL